MCFLHESEVHRDAYRNEQERICSILHKAKLLVPGEKEEIMGLSQNLFEILTNSLLEMVNKEKPR